MAVTQSTKNVITLRGSTQIVTEFFGYAINSILYQRGIYPAESFAPFQHYGLPMMVTADPALKKYLGSVLTQLSGAGSLGFAGALGCFCVETLFEGQVLRWHHGFY